MSDNDNELQKMAFSAMKSAAQLGVIATFCKDAMMTPNYNDFVDLLMNSLEQMGLSGMVVVYRSSVDKYRFGNGVDPEFFKEMSEKNIVCLEKIINTQSGFIIRSDDIQMIFNTIGMNENDIGLIRDNGALLFDFFNDSLKHRQEVDMIKVDHAKQSAKSLKNLEQLVAVLDGITSDADENIRSISSNVASKMMMLMPRLGLEFDQEDQVISLVQETLEAFKDYIGKQKNNNTKICSYVSNKIETEYDVNEDLLQA